MAEQSAWCVNHPDRAAVEHCEVCGNALCGFCLYYTGDGQRLCEIHAQQAKSNGVQIIPPAVYAPGIIPSQAVANQQQNSDKPKGVALKNRPIYEGNNYDVQAFVAMLLGFFTLSACCGGIYCLPFAAVLLGVVTLMNAKDAVDPRRTRQQAILGIATGGILAGGIVMCIVAYVGFYGSMIALVGSSNTNFQPYFATSTISAPATQRPFSTVIRSTVTPTDTPAPNLEPLQRTATAQAQDNSLPLDPDMTPDGSEAFVPNRP